MKDGLGFGDSLITEFQALYYPKEMVSYAGLYKFEFRDKSGVLVRETEFEKNIVVNDGLDYLLDAGCLTNAMQILLLGSSPTLAAGTSIGDITELTTNFSQTTRPVWTGVAGTQLVTNVAAKAHWDFTGALTVGGASLVTGSAVLGDTASTTLVTGRVLSGGDQVVASGWSLDVTIQVGGSDSGS